jgi:hypothetical protein
MYMCASQLATLPGLKRGFVYYTTSAHTTQQCFLHRLRLLKTGIMILLMFQIISLVPLDFLNSYLGLNIFYIYVVSLSIQDFWVDRIEGD